MGNGTTAAINRPPENRIEGINYRFGTAFKQQILSLWRPHHNLAASIASVATIGIAFIGLGALILSLARDATEVRIRYDDVCGSQRTCTVEFSLGEELKGPVFFYYQIRDFYQNLRPLFPAKSTRQLRGEDLEAGDLTTCNPIVLNKDLSTRQSIGNNFLGQNAVAFPCGGLAKAFFTGTNKVML